MKKKILILLCLCTCLFMSNSVFAEVDIITDENKIIVTKNNNLKQKIIINERVYDLNTGVSHYGLYEDINECKIYTNIDDYKYKLEEECLIEIESSDEVYLNSVQLIEQTEYIRYMTNKIIYHDLVFNLLINNKEIKLNDKYELVTIYNYLAKHIDYNYKAKNNGWYITSPEITLKTKEAICYDYASLLASMLRYRGIKTKMHFGYIDEEYHAWNEVLIDGKWYTVDLTQDAINYVNDYKFKDILINDVRYNNIKYTY